MREAQLPDGTVLQFPDETPDAVMDMTVKKHMGLAPRADARPEPKPVRDTGIAVQTPGSVDPPTSSDPHMDVAPRSKWADVAKSLALDPMLAASQRTSPIVRGLDGKNNYEKAPEELQKAYQELGPELAKKLDPQKYVILNDPDTGNPAIFLRNETMNEGLLSSIGRMASPGLLTTAPTRTPSGVTAAMTPRAKLMEEHMLAGISPSMMSTSTGRTQKILTNTLHDTPIAGNVIDNKIDKVTQQASAKANQLADQIGTGKTNTQAGDVLQGVAQKFVGEKQPLADLGMTADDVIRQPTRLTSFAQKADALYNRVDLYIKPKQEIDAGNTFSAITGTGRQFDNAELAGLIADKEIAKFGDVITKANGKLTYNDAKQLRSYIGKQLQKPATTADLDRAQLEAVYAGLTDDMRAALAQNPGGLKAFDQANNYYRTGLDRIKNALGEFEKIKSPEAAYDRFTKRTAEAGQGANSRQILALKRSMPQDEWDTVASYVLRDMGTPVKSARDASKAVNFSPSSFITRFEGMSDDAKSALFDFSGRADLKRELDALVSVLNQHKKIADISNKSGTMRNLGMVGVGSALVVEPMTTIAGLTGAATSAYAWTSPAFVKFVTGATRITADAANASRNLPMIVAQGKALAKQDPKLAPAIADYLRGLGQPAPADKEN